MGPSVGKTSRSTKSVTCTSARRARSSPRRARWSMTGKHFFIGRAGATVVPACSRRNAVQRPLSAGVTDIEVRLARPDEEVKWRASRATARLCGETQIEHWKPFPHPLQAIDLYDVGAPKDARQIAVAARIESDAKHVDPPCLSDMTAFRASSMR